MLNCYIRCQIGPLREGQAPAAPLPPASRSLGLDTTVTVLKPLFDLLHAGLSLRAAGWNLIGRKTVIANSNNRTMSCLKERLLVLVHQKQENVRTVCWKLKNLECRLMKAREEKGKLARRLPIWRQGSRTPKLLHSLHRFRR